MIIIISLVLLIVIGSLLLYNDHEWGTGVAGTILAIVSGMFLVICLISLIVNPMEVKSNINKFLATKATIEQTRRINHKRINWLLDAKTIDIEGVATIIENAAIQHKIIESNQWLAKEQYYNSTIFGLWIPDEVDNLKQMK